MRSGQGVLVLMVMKDVTDVTDVHGGVAKVSRDCSFLPGGAVSEDTVQIG